MPSILTRIELDVEQLVEHIRATLTKDPNAEIHINAPKDSAIKVSGPGRSSPSPTGGHGPGGPGGGK